MLFCIRWNEAPASTGLFGAMPAPAPALGGGLFGSTPAPAPAGKRSSSDGNPKVIQNFVF